MNMDDCSQHARHSVQWRKNMNERTKHFRTEMSYCSFMTMSPNKIIYVAFKNISRCAKESVRKCFKKCSLKLSFVEIILWTKVCGHTDLFVAFFCFVLTLDALTLQQFINESILQLGI